MDFNMKKLITLALIVGATTLTQAQSNLVFNRVLNFAVTYSTPATVPEGKVWKLEHNSGDLRIDKADVAYGIGISNVSLYNNNKPTWYSEGTVLFTSSSFSSLSILEFNVVPISSSSGGSGGGVSADGLVFSQMINEAIIITRTNTAGNILYSFEVPSGSVWKVKNLSQQLFSNGIFVPQNMGGSIALYKDNDILTYPLPTGNGGGHNPILLKEGIYQVVHMNPDNSGDWGGNRLFIEAIEYNIP